MAPHRRLLGPSAALLRLRRLRFALGQRLAELRPALPVVSASTWLQAPHPLHLREHRPDLWWLNLLIVPGLHQAASDFERYTHPAHGPSLAGQGIRVAVLDLSGRGRTAGNEDFGGAVHSAEVLAALQHLDQPDVPLAVSSFSLGCAPTATALCHPERPDVGLWLDWEGPSDRHIITARGELTAPAQGHSMHDDAYWAPREAVRHVGNTGVAYARFQAARDHAQPGELGHARQMVQAAMGGNLPWVRLNDHAPGHLPDSPRWAPSGPAEVRRWLTRTLGFVPLRSPAG